MDDLFGFLFAAAFVIFIVYLVAMFVTTVLVNAYVLLDPVLAGFGALPAPLAWGLTSGVFMALLHFACAESPSLRRPAFGKAATAVAMAWLGLAWLVGISQENAPAPARYTQARELAPSPPVATPRYSPPPSRPAQPRAPSPDPRLHETAYVDTQTLNVRAGPGTDFSIVDTVGDGALVRIFERRQASDGQPWVRIRAGTAAGWVSEGYLRSSGTPKAGRPVTTVAPEKPSVPKTERSTETAKGHRRPIPCRTPHRNPGRSHPTQSPSGRGPQLYRTHRPRRRQSGRHPSLSRRCR